VREGPYAEGRGVDVNGSWNRVGFMSWAFRVGLNQIALRGSNFGGAVGFAWVFSYGVENV
jgi:hypothetical protein